MVTADYFQIYLFFKKIGMLHKCRKGYCNALFWSYLYVALPSAVSKPMRKPEGAGVWDCITVIDETTAITFSQESGVISAPPSSHPSKLSARNAAKPGGMPGKCRYAASSAA
jgi:hypothetical protein